MKKEAFKTFLILKKTPVAVFLVLTLFFAGFFLVFKNNNSEEPNIEIASEAEFADEKCPDCVERKIDGVFVRPEESNFLPIAVMIDNNLEARPQYGLSRASLVYEAKAEGGITRYLAIFSGGEDLEKIGPIRSARPYFIDWAQEISALYVHCGGSPDALAGIAKSKIYDLDEFYNAPYFWRGKDKRAPHNIYTSGENLKKYIEKKNLELLFDYEPWKFEDGESNENPSNPEIEIGYLSPGYAVVWKYDIIKNDYIRFLAGKEHLDGNEEKIRAQNIIIQYLKDRVLDDKLRLEIKTVGEGSVIICNNGLCKEGFWKKISKNERTKFFNQDNEEFVLNRGTTWLEAVNDKIEINY